MPKRVFRVRNKVEGRPLGVSVLAFLVGLGGAVSLLAWLALTFLVSILPTDNTLLNLLLVGSGVVLLILGALGVLVAYLLWNGRQEGWYLAVLLWIINIVMGNYVLPLIFVFYFLKKNVQEFFGVKIGWSWGS